ncbi:hypothetical protein ACPVPU_09340 [Sphingomonas sp. CJ99]
MESPSEPRSDTRQRGTPLMTRIRVAAGAPWRRPVLPGGQWPLWLALLMAWTMVAVWAGGRWLERQVRADTARVVATGQVDRLRHAIGSAEHRTLAMFAGRPGAAQTMDELAMAIPVDDRLVQAGQDQDNRFVIEVVTVDPARLRAALRRSARFFRLRTQAERRTEGGMRVTLAGVVQ